MKLAWFSPLPPEHSDIANFTERLREDLHGAYDVRFFTEKPGGFLEPASGTFYHAGLGPCPYDLLVSLNASDLPIYNLGNNPTFFSQTWFLNQFKPGIVILHDVKLHHFFEGIYRERLGDEKRYLDLMAQYYGEIGREAGVAFCRSLVSISDMAEHFPMTAWAVKNALAVVVHTAYAQEVVRRATNVPVFNIPLPYRPQANPKRGAPVRFSRERRARLVIFGYLNTNRRIIEFLHALATMPERDCFGVHVVGTVFHEREVRAAVELLGLREHVTFYGYVSDDTLEDTLASADLAINLRYPTMGEASGSQLRIWDHALPSLVSASDSYADLPPDTVSFVRPEHERADVQRQLRRFLRHPGYFFEKGRRGREWLLAHHLPGMYVDALRPICDGAESLRSRHNRQSMAQRLGQVAAPWIDALPSHERERQDAARIMDTF